MKLCLKEKILGVALILQLIQLRQKYLLEQSNLLTWVLSSHSNTLLLLVVDTELHLQHSKLMQNLFFLGVFLIPDVFSRWSRWILKEKILLLFSPRDLENWFFMSVSRIANHVGVVLSELNENVVWLCMEEWVPWKWEMKGWGVPNKHVSFYSWHSKSLPASANSSTFSPRASSVTVQLLGPFAGISAKLEKELWLYCLMSRNLGKIAHCLWEGGHERSQTDWTLSHIILNFNVDN